LYRSNKLSLVGYRFVFRVDMVSFVTTVPPNSLWLLEKQSKTGVQDLLHVNTRLLSWQERKCSYGITAFPSCSQLLHRTVSMTDTEQGHHKPTHFYRHNRINILLQIHGSQLFGYTE